MHSVTELTAKLRIISFKAVIACASIMNAYRANLYICITKLKKAMKKICITFLAVMFLAAPAFAQNNGWFVSLGGGVNINQEGYRHDGGYGVAPALSVGAGMWFSPDLGVKLGYDGMKLKNDKFFKDGVDYNVLSASLLWNLSNTISGDDESRVVSFVPYAMFGASVGSRTALTAGAGLSMPISLSSAISIVPDIRVSYIQDKIYTDAYDKGQNMVFEPTLNLRYSF